MEVGVLGRVVGGGAGQGVGGGRAFQTEGDLRNNELSKQEKKGEKEPSCLLRPFFPIFFIKMFFQGSQV